MNWDKQSDVCETFSFNEGKVAKLKGEVEVVDGLAAVFKALADDTRIKIIYALTKEELCVCDIAAIIGSTVAAASHHLRFLKNIGLAKNRKKGKMVFYSLNDDCVNTIIESALTHYRHSCKAIK